jgi:hypothetical protein
MRCHSSSHCQKANTSIITLQAAILASLNIVALPVNGFTKPRLLHLNQAMTTALPGPRSSAWKGSSVATCIVRSL